MKDILDFFCRVVLPFVCILSVCDGCMPNGYKNKVTIGEKTFICVYIAPINWTSSGEYMMIPIEAKADKLARIRVPQSWTSTIYSNDTLMQRILVTDMHGLGAGSGISLASMGILSYQRVFRQVKIWNDPTPAPTGTPTFAPSIVPVVSPTRIPTFSPTILPTTSSPGISPLSILSEQVLESRRLQGVDPTSAPTSQPTSPTSSPSSAPSSKPSTAPSTYPSVIPSTAPSNVPSSQPTSSPSTYPSISPSRIPSSQPTTRPSSDPSSQPSSCPSSQPTLRPTSAPSMQPSALPTTQPSSQPSNWPSLQPTSEPTSQPTLQPVNRPTSPPGSLPTSQPSTQPSSRPSSLPSFQPSSQPSNQPSLAPSSLPTTQPSLQPSSQPTIFNTTGLPKPHYQHITFPLLFAIILVDKGKIKSIAWDNFCSWCSSKTCASNTVNYDDTLVSGEGGNCFIPDNECFVDITEKGAVVGQSVNTLCELNVYISWHGTDSNGANFQSAAYRFSRWSDAQMKNFTSVLMDEAVASVKV